jgi:hypothetical protein
MTQHLHTDFFVHLGVRKVWSELHEWPETCIYFPVKIILIAYTV